MKCEIHTVVFHLDVCLKLILLHSEPSTKGEWMVELSITEVCVCTSVCVCACVRACVCACMRACV